jgi:mechanosensitive ion channel-like protein
MDDRWSAGVWSGLAQVRERLAMIVPGLFALVTLVVLGVLAGWLARVIISRLARAVGFDHLLERGGVAASMRRSGISRSPSDALGTVGFWAIFVLFASAGIDAFAVPGAPAVTALLLTFLPSLFAAVLIMIAGWLVANFLSRGLLIAAVNAGVPEARMLARAAHWAVVLFAGATALTHLGIGKEMVLVAFGVTFGGLVLALALAFGLGGRAVAAEILARRLRRDSPPPQERLTHL